MGPLTNDWTGVDEKFVSKSLLELFHRQLAFQKLASELLVMNWKWMTGCYQWKRSYQLKRLIWSNWICLRHLSKGENGYPFVETTAQLESGRSEPVNMKSVLPKYCSLFWDFESVLWDLNNAIISPSDLITVRAGKERRKRREVMKKHWAEGRKEAGGIRKGGVREKVEENTIRSSEHRWDWSNSSESNTIGQELRDNSRLSYSISLHLNHRPCVRHLVDIKFEHCQKSAKMENFMQIN